MAASQDQGGAACSLTRPLGEPGSCCVCLQVVQGSLHPLGCMAPLQGRGFRWSFLQH